MARIVKSFRIEKEIWDAVVAEKQIQAFGWASFGYGFQCRYISIDELLDLAELDLYFTTCAVAEAIEEG